MKILLIYKNKAIRWIEGTYIEGYSEYEPWGGFKSFAEDKKIDVESLKIEPKLRFFYTINNPSKDGFVVMSER